MAEKYKSRGLVVIAVDVRSNETPEQVKAYAAQNGLKQILLMNGGRVASQFGVNATPTTFYINPEGAVASSTVGLEDPSQIESRTLRILPN